MSNRSKSWLHPRIARRLAIGAAAWARDAERSARDTLLAALEPAQGASRVPWLLDDVLQATFEEMYRDTGAGAAPHPPAIMAWSW
jgi:hypothetical protein